LQAVVYRGKEDDMKASRAWLRLAVLGSLLWGATANAQSAWGWRDDHSVRGVRSRPWTTRLATGRTVTYFYRDIPANCGNFTVQLGDNTHGGYGDCNLYIRYGALPTGSAYTRRSTARGFRKIITIRNPRAGRWYFRLYARSNYRTCLKSYASPYVWRIDMLDRINARRRQFARVPLTLHPNLHTSAQTHAIDMVQFAYYSSIGRRPATRTPDIRIRNTGYPLRMPLENIAHNYTTVASVMRYFFASHQEYVSLLHPDLRHAGFGYKASSDPWGPRWVQDFAQPW
jgi:hypothetical protein